MVGCHSNSGNPVSPGLNRTTQIFEPLGNWADNGYSVDSSSSQWTEHWPGPTLTPPGVQFGDLAVTDTFFDPAVSQMATVFVRAKRCLPAADAKISLIGFDMDVGDPPAPDIITSFAMDGVAFQYFCRNPSVEVSRRRATV